MKLKDLTVELSGNDNTLNRTVNIGPISDGLNFIYGERGAGKSTIRTLVSELLLDSCEPNTPQRTAVGCSSIQATVDTGVGHFQVARDALGNLSSNAVNVNRPAGTAPEPFHYSTQLDRELAESLSFVAFRTSRSRQEKLYTILQNRFQVPVGADAAMESTDAPRLRQQRIELQNQIDALHQELTRLRAQRLTATESTTLHGDIGTADIDRQISLLTTKLSEMDPNRIRLEIDSLQQEATRLRLEISTATTIVEKPQQPSRYLPTLYRLLDEVDQQIREIRVVQSNVQRHRVRLKEEMEFRNSVSVDEENHPYHRASEILRQIEVRINNADSHGDQWLENHPTHNAEQVSRFLDETCRSVRDDLQTLCDELSNQYRELRNRSATHELKELRYNFTHLSDLIQQLLDRRDSVVRELQIADPAGADAIRAAASDFCQLAISSGNLAARQRFVGPISELIDHRSPSVHVAKDTTLQQQQLTALESRLVALRSSLEIADGESIRISREISELNLKKSSLASLRLTQQTQHQQSLARIDEQIQLAERNLRSLTDQLAGIPQTFATPHPILVAASNILQRLTQGDFVHVWLSAERGTFEVQNRLQATVSTNNMTERGLSQLVHLALVMSANETSSSQTGSSFNCPMILDDLFADLPNQRIDATLAELSRWSSQNAKQVLVMTQHRFLADRIPEATIWEIEPESNAAHWRPATQESLQRVENLPVVSQAVQYRDEEEFLGVPVAEYPRSPLPRPYPLSKYPRTSDRDRVASYADFSQYDLGTQPELPIRTASTASTVTAKAQSEPRFQSQSEWNSFTQTTEVVSPAIVGDRISIGTIDESTRIESIALFDSAQLRCLENNQVFTVGDFFELNPQDDDQEFSACYLIGESLEHLQASAWLMNWVPGISANDAQALVACGISEPEHLLTSNIGSLFERVSRFLRSPDGRRFSNLDRTLDRNYVAQWQQRLRDNRNYRNQSRPRNASSRSSGSRRHSLRAFSPSDRSNYSSSDRQSNRRRDRDDRSYRDSSRERTDRDRDRLERERSSSRSQHRADYDDRAERSHQRQTVEREPMPTRSPRMQTPDQRQTRQPVPPIEPRERSRASRKPSAVRQTSGRQSINHLSETNSAETSTRSKSGSGSKSDAPKLRFYLDLSDHIEAAPSIGPKTGARFEAIGVHTIADFLKITAESLAEKLNYKRLNAKVIRQYQNQTRLVCRIPNLRGHDAQLLVGCGIIEAEELASMRPETLFAKVAPFSDTKEGLKIIRNGKKPDLEEITDWISFAQHNRSLQAA